MPRFAPTTSATGLWCGVSAMAPGHHSRYMKRGRMHLYIMRHGPADARSPTGRDYDRALTQSGRERTMTVARELGRLAQNPSRIFSSPLVRARETAQIVASLLQGTPSVEIRAELAPDGDHFSFVNALLTTDTSSLVVGHEPDVSELASRLLPGWRGHFDTAMIIGVEVLSGTVEQRFVIAPDRI